MTRAKVAAQPAVNAEFGIKLDQRVDGLAVVEILLVVLRGAQVAAEGCEVGEIRGVVVRVGVRPTDKRLLRPFGQEVAADHQRLHQEFAHALLDGIAGGGETRRDLGAVRKPAGKIVVGPGAVAVSDHQLAGIGNGGAMNGIEEGVGDGDDFGAHLSGNFGIAMVVGADQPVLEVQRIGGQNLDVVGSLRRARIAGDCVADDGSDDGAEKRADARQEHVQHLAEPHAERIGQRAADRARKLAADRAELAFGMHKLVGEVSPEHGGDIDFGGVQRRVPVDAGGEHRKAPLAYLLGHAAKPAARGGREHLPADTLQADRGGEFRGQERRHRTDARAGEADVAAAEGAGKVEVGEIG